MLTIEQYLQKYIAEYLKLSKRGKIVNRVSAICFLLSLLFDCHSLLSLSLTLCIYNYFFLVMFVGFQ